ncbi:hypothetical protein NDU88_010262 [Pleurodeles waltl]|uniref:Uncharacterized protein n=1 Tax=Pleurodeles waltl TaxID=8319 RepID=A0AAV7PXE1_PLEWA|nr:hypothetical protein NDU88_010262 [Pleurodeles waltl]
MTERTQTIKERKQSRREEEALVCFEPAGRQQTARTSGEETLENSASTEVKTESDSRFQTWNPVTCHVPGRAWLEQAPER